MIQPNTVITGDSLTVLRSMDDESVDMVITDPPYGIDYQSGRKEKERRLAKIKNDKAPFIWWIYDAARVVKRGGVLCFARWDVQQTFMDALRQKLVEMRKACPEIVKKKHSEGVKYKYAKIYDVWEKITPIMNELGVDFEVIGEKATRYAENGDPVYWITMQTKTYNGDKLMFLYEADLTIRWINLDNDDETLEAVVHALGWNDDPAKSKGAAHTYALKYYLFEKFSIDQGEDDPDNSDFGAQSKGPGGGSGGSRQGQQRQGQGSGRLSEAQLSRLYKKAEAAGMTKERTIARILEKYKKQDPATLTRQEYDEICNSLDAAAAQHNQQGGQG